MDAEMIIKYLVDDILAEVYYVFYSNAQIIVLNKYSWKDELSHFMAINSQIK